MIFLKFSKNTWEVCQKPGFLDHVIRLPTPMGRDLPKNKLDVICDLREKTRSKNNAPFGRYACPRRTEKNEVPAHSIWKFLIIFLNYYYIYIEIGIFGNF